MKKIKRLIASIIIVCMFAGQAMAIWPLVASICLHAIVIGGYCWWKAERSGSTSAHSTSGNTKTPSNVTWVELTDGTPTVRTGQVNTRVDNQDLRNAVNAQPTRYPLLKGALQASDTYHNGDVIPEDQTAAQQVGKKAKISGTTYYLGSVKYSSTTATSPNTYEMVTATWTLRDSTTIQYELWVSHIGVQGVHKVYWFTKGSVTTEGTQEATNAEFATNFNASPETFSGEIDDLIKSNPNIVHFDDPTDDRAATGGTGSYQMPTAPSASQIYTAIANQNNSGSNTAANDAATSAAQAAENARQRYIASGGDPATGIGGEPALYQSYLDALARAAAAAAAAAQTQNENDNPGAATPGLPDSLGDPEQFSFSGRFTQFIDDMKTTPVFSLPSDFLDADGLSTSNSIITIGTETNIFGQHTIDFSSQEYMDMWLVIKILVIFAASVAAFRIVALKGGGG